MIGGAVALVALVLWIKYKGAAGVGSAMGGVVVDMVTGVLSGTASAAGAVLHAGAAAANTAITGNDPAKNNYWDLGLSGSGQYPGTQAPPSNVFSL